MTEDLTSPADPVMSYWTGQVHDSHAALLADYRAESDATIDDCRPALDVRYGAHPREVFDVYRATGNRRGMLVYYHGGYWQARGKEQFRFLAPAFLAQGIDVVLPNYPLCPDVTLPALVASVRSGLKKIIEHVRIHPTDTVIIAGHSAGAHLAAELALTDWNSHGLAANPVTGILAISGVYELTPLLRTPINAKLSLTSVTASAMSPLRRVRGKLPPAVFSVGSLETSAFNEQSAQMCGSWVAAGGSSSLIVAARADHYSILRQLKPSYGIFEATTDLFAEPP